MAEGTKQAAGITADIKILSDVRLPSTLLTPALQAAIEAGGMGLWEWQPDTDTAHWNPQLYDLLRLPRGSGVEPGSRSWRWWFPRINRSSRRCSTSWRTTVNMRPVG